MREYVHEYVREYMLVCNDSVITVLKKVES